MNGAQGIYLLSMMAEPDRVTVIATVLNEAETIGDLISGLSQQTLADIEIIVVDGGSADGTWERLQELAREEPRLRPIRDESCNLAHSPGPIARGRNRAIREASTQVIACADAGCQYEPEWAARLTAPIRAGEAEYSLGGSYIDARTATAWDVAAAPFLGIKLRPEGIRKSCTTRSMAMRKELWERVGGFPEVNLFGEDTLFDLRAREVTTPGFPAEAMARYNPRFSLSSAAEKLGLYATSDGVLGVRRMRFVRHALRCIAQVAALVALHWTAIPLLADILLEIFFAFERDRRGVFNRRFYKLLPARLIFSWMTPWIVAYHHIAGSITKANRSNPQNAQ
jgi:glycosyltransferase involved in cell wall biosynthesis